MTVFLDVVSGLLLLVCVAGVFELFRADLGLRRAQKDSLEKQAHKADCPEGQVRDV